MKRILLFVLLLSVSFADMKFNYGSFNDSSTFIQTAGGYLGYRDNKDESTFNADYYRSPSLEKFKISFNNDWNYQEEYSQFVFIEHKLNKYSNGSNEEYQRLGCGVSWLPTETNNRMTFPFLHKYSVAIVKQSEKQDLYLSWRYKFDMAHGILRAKAVFFYLGLNSTLYLKLGVQAHKNVVFNYIIEREWTETKFINTSSVGVEVSL